MKGGHSLGQGVDGAEYIGLGAPLPFGGRDSWGGTPGAGCGCSRCGLVAAGLQEAMRKCGGVWLGPDPAQDHLWAC